MDKFIDWCISDDGGFFGFFTVVIMISLGLILFCTLVWVFPPFLALAPLVVVGVSLYRYLTSEGFGNG